MINNENKKEKRYDDEGMIIIAENVPIILSGEFSIEDIKEEE